MGKLSLQSLLFLTFLFLWTAKAYAQEYGLSDQGSFHPHSVRKIFQSDIAFSKTIWLKINLQLPSNRPLFYAGYELPKFLINAALEGKINAYRNDSLQTVLTKEELQNRLFSLPSHQNEKEKSYEGAFKINAQTLSDSSTYDVKSISELEIKQDWLFDKRHSRIVHDVHCFTFFAPIRDESNVVIFHYPVASFSYKEIIEKLFRPRKEDFVMINGKRFPNLETLVDNRIFHGYIVKYNNYEDSYLDEKYAPHQAWIKGMQYEERLIEFEGFLWEY